MVKKSKGDERTECAVDDTVEVLIRCLEGIAVSGDALSYYNSEEARRFV